MTDRARWVGIATAPLVASSEQPLAAAVAAAAAWLQLGSQFLEQPAHRLVALRVVEGQRLHHQHLR